MIRIIQVCVLKEFWNGSVMGKGEEEMDNKKTMFCSLTYFLPYLCSSTCPTQGLCFTFYFPLLLTPLFSLSFHFCTTLSILHSHVPSSVLAQSSYYWR